MKRNKSLLELVTGERCAHDWSIIDKWISKGKVYYEFYCVRCLEIRVVTNAKQ